MLFLTSLLYVLIGFWIAVWTVASIRAEWPLIPAAIVTVGVHAVIFSLFAAVVRVTLRFWRAENVDPLPSREQLQIWLDVRGCRWLNVAGILVVGLTSLWLLTHGGLSWQGWMLVAAVVIAFRDLLANSRAVALPMGLPPIRCSEFPCELDQGKEVCFHWHRWSAPATSSQSELAVFVSEAHLNAARIDSHQGQPFSRWVKEHFTDSIRQIVLWFRGESVRQQFVTMQEVENVVSFVRAIRYVSDQALHGVDDYFSYPIETLCDDAGDCEDHAFLAATILHHLGHEVALFHLESRDTAHLALGYYVTGDASMLDGVNGPFSANDQHGREFYYVETVPTSTDERVGDISRSFLADLKSVKVHALV
jgi:predicted transglutaminase-like cysteine proteinase